MRYLYTLIMNFIRFSNPLRIREGIVWIMVVVFLLTVSSRIVLTDTQSPSTIDRVGAILPDSVWQTQLKKEMSIYRSTWPFPYKDILAGLPGANGMLGANKTKPQFDPGSQRSTFLFHHLSLKGDSAGVDAFWPAIDALYARQLPDGSFESHTNQHSLGAQANEIAFAQARLSQGLLALEISPLGANYQARIDAVLPKLNQSLDYIVHGTQTNSRGVMVSNLDSLKGIDARSPNRLALDAAFFIYSGLLLKNLDYVKIGNDFIDLTFAKEATDGAFLETTGGDVSYQVVTIWYLTELLNLEGITSAPKVDQLRQAVSWTLARINPTTGAIDTSDSTRVNGQEMTSNGISSHVKGPNLHEMGIGLYTFNVLLDDPDHPIVPHDLPLKVYTLHRAAPLRIR